MINRINQWALKYFTYENFWQSLIFVIIAMAVGNLLANLYGYFTINSPFSINLDYFIPIIAAIILRKTPVSGVVFLVLYFLVFALDIAKLILSQFNFEENIFNIIWQFYGAGAGLGISLYFKNMAGELSSFIALGSLRVVVSAIAISLLTSLTFFYRRNYLLSAIVLIGCLVVACLLMKGELMFTLSFLLGIFFILIGTCTHSLVRANMKGFNLLIILYVIALTISLFNTARDLSREKIYRSDLIEILSEFNVTETGIEAASADLFDHIESGQAGSYDNVILIVLESFGLLADDKAMQDILGIFNNAELLNFYDVSTGSISAKGGTKAAEIRELCRYSSSGIASKKDAHHLSSCLPIRLKDMGYNTIGIHNSMGSNFRRDRWYSVIGFDEIYFMEDIAKKYNIDKRCGYSFPGICERDMMNTYLPDIIGNNGKNFLHFLTVESHVPSKEHDMHPDFHNICKKYSSFRANEEVCYLIDLQYRMLEDVITMAKKYKDSRNYIIVVGDHAPPFHSIGSVRQYVLGKVPYIIIKTKDL